MSLQLYKKVSCAYNNSQFYANIQDKEDATLISFKFEDLNIWKKMNSKELLSL